jgi:hypothetical protein
MSDLEIAAQRAAQKTARFLLEAEEGAILAAVSVRRGGRMCNRLARVIAAEFEFLCRWCLERKRDGQHGRYCEACWIELHGIDHGG